MAPPALPQEPAVLQTKVQTQPTCYMDQPGHRDTKAMHNLSSGNFLLNPEICTCSSCSYRMFWHTQKKAKVLSKTECFLWHFLSPDFHGGWTPVAQGCPYSAASLATGSQRLFVFLHKGSALLTEETALQATQGDLGDHLIIHASCN